MAGWERWPADPACLKNLDVVRALMQRNSRAETDAGQQMQRNGRVETNAEQQMQ